MSRLDYSRKTNRVITPYTKEKEKKSGRRWKRMYKKREDVSKEYVYPFNCSNCNLPLKVKFSFEKKIKMSVGWCQVCESPVIYGKVPMKVDFRNMDRHVFYRLRRNVVDEYRKSLRSPSP